MIDEQIKDLLRRVSKLEAAVFSSGKSSVEPKAPNSYTGITGGIRHLAEQKQFFDVGKTLGEVKKELEKNNYHSSLQAVQMALKRLSRTGGPLIGYKDGKKKYAKRK